MKNIFIYTYSIEKKTLNKMAHRKYYTEMKENVSPKNAAFELTNLKRLHKSQLINLLLQQNAKIKQLEQQTINDNNKKPIPKPRKNVKQMVQDYEDNMYLLTEWEGRTGKYLARGQGVRTERSEVRTS